MTSEEEKKGLIKDINDILKNRTISEADWYIKTVLKRCKRIIEEGVPKK